MRQRTIERKRQKEWCVTVSKCKANWYGKQMSIKVRAKMSLCSYSFNRKTKHKSKHVIFAAIVQLVCFHPMTHHFLRHLLSLYFLLSPQPKSIIFYLFRSPGYAKFSILYRIGWATTRMKLKSTASEKIGSLYVSRGAKNESQCTLRIGVATNEFYVRFCFDYFRFSLAYFSWSRSQASCHCQLPVSTNYANYSSVFHPNGVYFRVFGASSNLN